MWWERPEEPSPKQLELPKADVPGHPAHDCDSGTAKGGGKGCAGHHAALPTATTTDVYTQELPDGVRATINSIHRGWDTARAFRSLRRPRSS